MTYVNRTPAQPLTIDLSLPPFTTFNRYVMSSLPEIATSVSKGRPSGGLTSDEAWHRLEVFGPNGTPDTTTPPWRRALGKFWAPVPWMLEAAIVLQLVLGEYVEAAVIAALLTFNAALGYFQENRAQATLDALKSRLALVTPVWRDGAWKTVPVAQLVPGDIVKLSLGCIVGADVRLLEGEVLLDHSTLTGESLPIEGGPGLQTYAGALVRRGEAVAEVTATGSRTKFGQTAELVRIAHVTSSQQQAVMRVVRNLAMFNVAIVLVQIGYASSLHMPLLEIVPLALTAVLAAIPVALPATFTLATALGARVLAKLGVLPTRLSSIDEAASMDVLCVDKTGTLTRNELAVTAVRAMVGFDEAHVLGLAALASSEGGQDPVDAAIRNASHSASMPALPRLVRFVPFDPANRMSEAFAADAHDGTVRIVKGAFERVSALTQSSPAASAAAQALQAKGFRVLAVAVGTGDALTLAGLIALSDPPRADSAELIADLLGMGVHTVMVTGDAVTTAAVVAHVVGLEGAVCPPGPPPASLRAEQYAVFAGVFPEDKFHIVKAFQSGGHIVGMCGDGANDAPALRQAQMGIAVSTATDVAKSAAGIVLTEPGLGGIVTSVREGRITFQRILTYMLRSVTRKIDQMLFLTVGLIMTGHAVLTPMLMVVLMTTGDFLAMSSTTDNVRPSQKPNAWQINHVTIAGIALACCNLLFCSGLLAVGKFWLALGTGQLQTLAVVILAFSGQAVLYVVRERRRLWSSRPGRWLILSSVVDVSLIAALATRGILMSSLPVLYVGTVFGAAIVFAFALDLVKVALFGRLKMT
jgi:H+-transporting ATPase